MYLKGQILKKQSRRYLKVHTQFRLPACMEKMHLGVWKRELHTEMDIGTDNLI